MMPDYPCGTVGYPLWKFPGKSRQPGSSWLFSFLFCNKQRLINGVSLFFLHLYVFSFFLFPFFLPFIKKNTTFFNSKKKSFLNLQPQRLRGSWVCLSGMGAVSPVAGAWLWGGTPGGGWGWGGNGEAGIRAFSHGFVYKVFDVNPVNTTLTNGFHSLPLFALLPWLQVFWPISPSCSCSHRCVCHPPILSHSSPSVVIRYSLSRSFPPAKKKKAKASLQSSYLQIPFVSCYSLLRAGTLPDHRDPSSPGVPFAPGTLAGISEARPHPPHPQSGCVLAMSGSKSLNSNLQQEVLVSLMRDGN